MTKMMGLSSVRNKKLLPIVLAMYFLMACSLSTIIPNSASGGAGATSENTSANVPTVLATSIQEDKECLLDKVKESDIVSVDAYPKGLNLRKSPDGDVVIIVPDKSNVFLISNNGNWSKVAYISTRGLVCGYVATEYLQIANQ